jgi:ankyrin repeat protein
MPLHVTSLRGEVASAQALLEHGATVNAQDRIHRTPLYQASKAWGRAVGTSRVVRVLLEHRADLKPGLWGDGDRTP